MRLPPQWRYLIFVAAVYLAYFTFLNLYLRHARSIVLTTPKGSYLHHEIIPVHLKTRNPFLIRLWKKDPPRLAVQKDGEVVTTVGGLDTFAFRYDADHGLWVARWPCPWNAPTGAYLPTLALPVPQRKHLKAQPFQISRRKPKKISDKMTVLTFENIYPLATLKVPTPQGEVRDWRGLVDWAQFLGVDAFWILAGLTPGLSKKGGGEEVWVSYNFPLLAALGQECHRRGIRFGVWAVAYATQPGSRKLPRYEYALEYENGNFKPTRSISLRDPQRPRDLAQLLQKLEAIPEVDMVGLDYIRNVFGGYELADDFARQMPGVRLPPDWWSLAAEQRMRSFALEKIGRQDRRLIDQWQWWRAHRAAQIVAQIRSELKTRKPLWVFTLSWEKGWHHGQDPVMMNDAGADLDAVMLYEANQIQFETLLKDWHRYLKSSHVQVLAGNVLDWPLHQKSANPPAPTLFYDRLMQGYRKLYSDRPAKGIFIHDLSRALWGRRGPYSTAQWMEAAQTAVQHVKTGEPL